MSVTNGGAADGGKAVVLGWVIPRPTGRWHQAIVVTDRHVWITPELTFAENEKMTADAAAGRDAFHDFVRTSGWIERPPRCNLTDVRGLNWNPTTGWIRIAAAGDDVLGAMIPNRETGDELEPKLKKAIALQLAKRSEQR